MSAVVFAARGCSPLRWYGRPSVGKPDGRGRRDQFFGVGVSPDQRTRVRLAGRFRPLDVRKPARYNRPREVYSRRIGGRNRAKLSWARADERRRRGRGPVDKRKSVCSRNPTVRGATVVCDALLVVLIVNDPRGQLSPYVRIVIRRGRTRSYRVRDV